MIDARLLDGDHHLSQTVLLDRLAKRCHGHGEVPALVGQDRGRQQQRSVEVGEHPLGAGLGAVHADDAETLRPGLLHQRLQRPARLEHGAGTTYTTASRSACSDRRDRSEHDGYLHERGRKFLSIPRKIAQ